ncbi:MAG TPA: T9SS type A sorting domain-containing protein [Bacteroidota bacterium]|nr:T9SS type A sorting domain-containing protein [Bacteroidota bacterium]
MITVVSILGFVLLTVLSTCEAYSQEPKSDPRESNHPGGGARVPPLPFFSGARGGPLNVREMPAVSAFAKKIRTGVLNPSRSSGAAFYVIDTVTAVSTYDTTRYTFAHDAFGSVVSISVKKWIDGEWVDSCRYFYAEAGYELTEVLEDWALGQWVNVDSVTYTFDFSGDEIARVHEQWTNGDWVSVDSVAYSYDVFGNLFSVWENLWTNGQWVSDWRDTYEYDEYGNTSSVLKEVWTNGQWVNDLRYTNTAGSNGRILSGLTEQWTNSQWVNVERTTYKYYTTGEVFEEVNQQWGNSEWANVDSSVYTYNAFGQTLSQSEKQWTNSQWVNFDSTAYSYDANGNSLTQLDEQWTNGRWMNVDRTSYLYDSDGLETSASFEVWQDSLWVPADGNLYFSDGVGDYSYYNACTIYTIYANTATGVASGAAGIPLQFALSQNYPNPFNPSTIIQFTVPSNGRAVLKVYNILGQEVATLFNGNAAAGSYHQVQFNASNLASGIYFSQLEFGGKVQIKKMLLLK